MRLFDAVRESGDFVRHASCRCNGATAFAAVLAASVIGCAGSRPTSDAGLDDAATTDAGGMDASVPDAATADAGTWSLISILHPDDSRAGDGFGNAADIDDHVAAVYRPGIPSDVFIYRRTGDAWQQDARLGPVGEAFGMSLAVSGDTVVVGCPGGPTVYGAYVIEFEGGAWVQKQRLTAPGTDRFGASVAIDGERIVVGAPGLVYVYVRIDTGFRLEDVVGPVNDVQLGETVSISGDTMVAGAQHAVHVFTRQGESWNEQATLAPEGHGDLWSAAVSGDRIIVGAPCAVGDGGWNPYPPPQCTGAAYIYRREGNAWVEEQRFDPEQVEDEGFGCSVDMAGDTALIHTCSGASGPNGDRQVLIFQRDGTVWRNTAVIMRPAGETGAGLSRVGNVAIFGGSSEVASPGEPPSAGAAYIFAR